MIESRHFVTAHEVLHITLDREAKVIGQIDEWTISYNSCVLEFHRKLLKEIARETVCFVHPGDSLGNDLTIAVNIH